MPSSLRPALVALTCFSIFGLGCQGDLGGETEGQRSALSQTLFSTGFEAGDTAPTWRDTLDFSQGVSGYNPGLDPEASIRQERAHGGARALMYSGTDNNTATSYAYARVFAVNLPVTANTQLSYWLNPDQANGAFEAVDLHFTNGTTLRDSGAKDQRGCSAHPHAGHCGAAKPGSWTNITVHLGAYVAGRTIDRIWVGYDQPGNTGQFRGYVDDLSITNTLSGGDGGIVETALKVPTAVTTGQTLSASVTLTNTGSSAVTLKGVVLAGRPPGGTHAGGPYDDLAPSLGSTSIASGASVTLVASRAMSIQDAVGSWEIYPTYQDASGAYHDLPGAHVTLQTPGSDGGAGDGGGTPPVTADANVAVDFSAHGYATNALSVGSCISTYANGGTNLIKGSQQTLWKQYLQDLGPLGWRIPLYYHDGTVGSSAGGIHGGSEGAAYITAIKSMGGTPIIAVGGSTNDNDIQAADAAALVHYFNDHGGQHGGPVTHFVIGNEPDNGFGLTNYIHGGSGSDGFHAIVQAMRAASSSPLIIAGPALTSWADYKYDDYRSFFAADNADVDVVDFHKYGDGQRYENIHLTSEYSDAVAWLRQQINASFGARASSIAIQDGEFNYHPFYDGWGDAFYTSRNLVHTASVLGHLLVQGGRGYQYSDSNGPLGLVTDGSGSNDQPNGKFIRLPAYWGMTVWTGGQWGRRFGSVMAKTSTTLPQFEVYATDSPKKVILINTSTTTDRNVVLSLGGLSSGTYSAWRYNRGLTTNDFDNGPQFQPPTRALNSAAFSGGKIAVSVPYLSVVVLDVD